MVNDTLLACVKEGATIINAARAGIVDEDALRKARREKSIRFLNDVYPKDEPGPKSVAEIADIMLPHLGASTTEANYKAARRAAEELIDLDEKGITSFIVNRDIPEGLDESYCELANTLARLCRCLVGRDATPKLVETSFYGTLEQYGKWLLVPIVAGIWDDFDRSVDYGAGRKYLDEMGIDYVNRPIDTTKGYENSITVDMTAVARSGELRSVSIRGTVAEGVLMVSRINEFNKLWFEPTGHTVMFIYDDRPGVLGAIGVKLASRDVNIEDVRNPHDPKTNHSLAIMKINKAPSAQLIDEIADEIKAISAFTIKL
jgi:D-3-phosphoglycerate dehydrogenase